MKKSLGETREETYGHWKEMDNIRKAHQELKRHYVLELDSLKTKMEKAEREPATLEACAKDLEASVGALKFESNTKDEDIKVAERRVKVVKVELKQHDDLIVELSTRVTKSDEAQGSYRKAAFIYPGA